MRVVLLCHAATAATHSAAFAHDADQVESAELRAATALAPTMPRAERILRAPSRRCGETAIALGLIAEPEPALEGCDFGTWAGRKLDDLMAESPESVRAWLSDPSAGPHGGESLATLTARLGRWLDGLAGPRATLAVVDPTVARAAISYAVTGGPGSIFRFDVAPLSRTVLVGEPGRWSLRALEPRR